LSTSNSESDKGYKRVRHNTIPADYRCPKCKFAAKNQRQVKHHKNLSSLDWHLTHYHKDDVGTNELKELVKQFNNFSRGPN